MTTEIISIGDELLIGQVVNTNASWIAEQLNLAGIEVMRITTIADTGEEILRALDEASSRAEVILLTGGLGPTRDDITKKTLCNYFDTGLVFNEEAFENIVKLFGNRGLPINDINRQQAEIPENCTPIMNDKGTASGMWFEKEGKIYVSMPGVPYEMKSMMSREIMPKLASRLSGLFILHKKVITQGVGESWLAEMISEWEDGLPEHMKLAYLPQPGMVRLRLSGSAQNAGKLNLEMDQQIEKLAGLIPELIFGYGEVSLEEVLGNLLKERGQSLSTAESCTGGYIAHLITSIPGSSACFNGSVVAYSNQVKTTILGVKEETLIAYGAVSEQCVTEMARGVKDKFNTDYSIAISGIAGPDGGTDEKPVGTVWIAIAGPDSVFTKKYIFGNDRQRIIRVAALTAMNQLRLMILKEH